MFIYLTKQMNYEVTQFLDQLKHPLRQRIEELRAIILESHPELEENIKWNGPNYTFNGTDRITIRVNPIGALNLILHMGAKSQSFAQPLIRDDHDLLVWKSHDRAVADFRKEAQFDVAKPFLKELIKKWLSVPV